MADRALIWCPMCDRNSTQQELMRGAPESHLFRCQLGHVFTYEQLHTLNPRMIKLEFVEKPNSTDIKAQIWVNPDVWQKFCTKYQNQQISTISAVLGLLLDDHHVIISGEQAKKLRDLGIRNGAEMVANAEEVKRVTAENEQLVKENARFIDAIAGKMAEAEA